MDSCSNFPDIHLDKMILHVPDCSLDIGNGVLPMNEIRISFLGSTSVPGK